MTQQLRTPADFPTPTREQWLALVEKDLKGAPFEKRLVTQLIEGLTIQPLYTGADAPQPESMGLPGQAPFARGAKLSKDTTSGWLIVSEHRHPLPSQANANMRADLERGAHGVLVRLSQRLLGEENVCAGCTCGGGVLVDGSGEFDALFAGVELTKTNVTLAAGPAFAAVAAQFIALAQRQGVTPDRLQVQFGADPLGTLAAKGSLPRSAESMLNEMANLAQWSSQRAPGCRAVSVSTAPYDNAGATAVQELAAALATGVAYLRSMENVGLSVAAASRQIQFSLSVGCDQFLEIAKLRAMRMLWNRVLEAALVAEDQRSISLHARTSRRVLTQRDPWVNVLRTTIGCFAAAIAGADSITVLPYDDVIGPSDEAALRLARNTQIILQEEGQLAQVLDAAGGSYYVDHLTLSLANASWTQFQRIESRGGMSSVLRDGSFAKEIGEVWQKRAKDLGRRKTPVTGVSEFPNLREAKVSRDKVDTSSHESAILERRNAAASDARLQKPLSDVVSASGSAQIEALLAASNAGASLIALHESLGKSPEKAEGFHLRRFAAAFEQLRDASDQVLAERGSRPNVFSANMGPIAVHTARATFSQNFFEAGGFEVLTNDGFPDVESAAAAFASSGTKRVVICSADAWYEEHACDLARTLKQKGAAWVILAGNPGQNEVRYREAGVDQFIFIGCDVLGTLTELARSEKVAS